VRYAARVIPLDVSRSSLPMPACASTVLSIAPPYVLFCRDCSHDLPARGNTHQARCRHGQHSLRL
jgi:hypothetical protein